MDSAASRLLILIRFQTPRNVPGKSMKITPVTMYVINRRESDCSRAMARSMMDLVSSSSPISGLLRAVLQFFGESYGVPPGIRQASQAVDRESLRNKKEDRDFDDHEFYRFR